MKHLCEKIQFPRISVSQGSAEALIRWCGKYSIFWFLTFSEIFLPNIMKIRQCFLEL